MRCTVPVRPPAVHGGWKTASPRPAPRSQHPASFSTPNSLLQVEVASYRPLRSCSLCSRRSHLVRHVTPKDHHVTQTPESAPSPFTGKIRKGIWPLSVPEAAAAADAVGFKATPRSKGDQLHV